MIRLTCKKSGKAGVTLLELLVFMALALMIVAGLVPATLLGNYGDLRNEESLAAFMSCKSTVDALKKIPFDDLVVSGSGFSEDNGRFVRSRTVTFYKRGSESQADINGTETTELTFGINGLASNCIATVQIEWQTRKGFTSSDTAEESVSAILSP